MQNKLVIILLIFILSIFSTNSFALNPADYLILEEIKPYQIFTPPFEKQESSPFSVNKEENFFGESVHFNISYSLKNDFTSITTTQVRVYKFAPQHFLIHNIEPFFRNENKAELLEGTVLQNEGGNYFFSLDGGKICCRYAWLSKDNTLIFIMGKKKGENLSLIKAYLNKYPSIIPALVFDQKHNIDWIKEEMEMQMQTSEYWLTMANKDNNSRNKLRESIFTFLQYCKVYLDSFGEEEKEDFNILFGSKDIVKLEKEIKKYRAWWNAHKNDELRWPK